MDDRVRCHPARHADAVGLRAGATIVGGTPTKQGTFTFTVDNVPYNQPGAPPSQGTYSITVHKLQPLAITSTSPMPSGTVGAPYAQGFFLSGGVGPHFWSVVSGTLPHGLGLVTTVPGDYGNQLAGTPTQAGTFTFTMKVSDGINQQATMQFTLTINP